MIFTFQDHTIQHTILYDSNARYETHVTPTKRLLIAWKRPLGAWKRLRNSNEKVEWTLGGFLIWMGVIIFETHCNILYINFYILPDELK